MIALQTDYKAKTVRAYDALAAELAPQFDGFFERFAHKEASHFLAGLERGSLILDLGCGGGAAWIFRRARIRDDRRGLERRDAETVPDARFEGPGQAGSDSLALWASFF